jgi:hypothetical protein
MPEHNLVRMPLIVIPLIIGLIVVGFGGGIVTQDFFESNNQEEQVLVIEPTPSPIITLTSKPQVVYKLPEATPTPLVDQDPVITCNWSKGSKCEGQSISLRKSECPSGGSYVCCQVEDTWQLITSTTCSKIRQNDAIYAEKMLKVIEDSTEKRKAIKDNFLSTAATNLEKMKREAADMSEKSRKDLEDYKKQTSSETDQFIQSSGEKFRQDLDKITETSIMKGEAMTKQLKERLNKELYDMCAGNVFTKYDRNSGRLRIERNNSLVKQYEDELAQCAFLYK